MVESSLNFKLQQIPESSPSLADGTSAEMTPTNSTTNNNHDDNGHDNNHDHNNKGEDIKAKLAQLEASSNCSLGSDSDDSDDDDFHNPAGQQKRRGSTGSHSHLSVLSQLGLSRQVLASKWLVAAVLVSVTAVLGYYTYKYTREEEVAQYETQFLDYADEIVDQSLTILRSFALVLQSFGKTTTSLAVFSNLTWPLLTLPHFETRAADLLFISRAQQVSFTPIVQDVDREAWEAYSVANQHWIQEGIDFEYIMAESYLLKKETKQYHGDETPPPSETEATTRPAVPGFNREGFNALALAKPIQPYIWSHAPLTHRPTVELSKGPHLPIWQTFPPPRSSFTVNYNLLSEYQFSELVNVSTTSRTGVLSGVMDNMALFGAARTTELNPKSVLLQPVFESFSDDAPIMAYLIVDLSWDIVFHDVLYEGASPVLCVLKNSCGQVYTFEVSGPNAIFLGVGDMHDPGFDGMEIVSDLGLSAFAKTGEAGELGILASVCDFSLHIYPTQDLYDRYITKTPLYTTMAVIGVFAFTTLVFLLYDLMVQRQQSTLAATAEKTTAIISKLFPQEVHDRLFSSNLASERNTAPKFRMISMVSEEDKLKQQKQENGQGAKKLPPIADLFPDCTVLFCDISGFTAWSSIRNPIQVFQLLEAVYTAFDAIAHRRGVFKVETIGDSYLAVTGLPTPRDDHAVVMVRFAFDCLTKMKELAQELTLELGPGTEELSMRFGLHSGPVTAGVLRGEKTRFQLFGDTVNTASRMESTGLRDKIQISEETAELIIAAGKEKWLKPREEKIHAKGKGELQTYWAHPRMHVDDQLLNPDSHHTQNNQVGENTSTRQLHNAIASVDGLDEQKKRSISWLADIMLKLLRQISARRSAAGFDTLKRTFSNGNSRHFAPSDGKLVVEEVQDIIVLPDYDQKVARKYVDPDTIKIPEPAVEQLHSYISRVALLYRDNPFHNIHHAAHVTMSMSKLLARIVAPELEPTRENGKHFEALRHDHTYGITSDPLTQFAVVFAALIHDADHPGCPNASLVKAKTETAQRYQNRCVAEQNSFDLCWDMLMEPQYRDLRTCIYGNKEELKRFRQLVINSIIATDISDKDLSMARKARWNKAFNIGADGEQEPAPEKVSSDLLAQGTMNRNRKATIVIEHLIQASDVAHTMQHWHIYMKWNEKLFEEMYKAYLKGQLESDPALSWYQGELGFYDFYIIPLAKKLKDCGVFGVSSAENLNYALANRAEWEQRGKELVAGYVQKYAGLTELKEPGSMKRLSIAGRLRQSIATDQK